MSGLKSRGGWRVTKSDKGVYASESAQLFGSEIGLANVLRDESVRRVIDAFAHAGIPGRDVAHGTDGRSRADHA